MKKTRIVLAITGASGILYALEFLRLMREAGVEVHGIVSAAGEKVMRLETGLDPDDLHDVTWYKADDFTAPMASGSSLFDGMLVLPCTMGTLGAIANGISANLIHRAADVMLKERRPLLLAARETPLNRTHIHNMLKADKAGAVICPPMPSFYCRPADLTEMARFFAGRLAALLGISVSGLPRWEP